MMEMKNASNHCEKPTAVITGGSRGIGLAIAKQLGLDGFSIVINGTKTEATYSSVMQWFSEHNIPAIYVQADISCAEARSFLVDSAMSAFGTIDVLVNNAGIAPKIRRDLMEMPPESLDQLLEVNTKAPLFLTQLVAQKMLEKPKEERRGRIVFITSCSAVVSSITRGEYCISKAAESMVATLFADRLAEENIFVYEVRPGVIRTDMTAQVQAKYDALMEQGYFPIKRWGEAEDVARTVGALCSGAFNYSTGNVIDVDGGFHIRRL